MESGVRLIGPAELRLLALSAVIMLALTALFMVNGGAYDLAVSEYFRDLGRSHEWLKKMAAFLSGSALSGKDLRRGEIGQILSELLLIGCALVLIMAQFSRLKLKIAPYIIHAKYIAVVSLVGPLLIVRVLKWLTARPRPRDLGSLDLIAMVRVDFLPLFTFDYLPAFWSFSAGSFPSGHVAQAAILLCIPFCLYHEKRVEAAAVAALVASAYVALMGTSRMVLGAHWPGDLIWACYIVLLVAWIMYRLILSPSGGPIRAATSVDHEKPCRPSPN